MTNQGTWDADLYAANSAHHRGTDDLIVADLEPAGDARVVDVGCGHGDLTARLATLVPAGEVIGLDASAEMVGVAAARHRAANLRFERCAAQQVGAEFEPGSVDAIVSVACLHWVPGAEHPAMLSGFAAVLRPGGAFRVDFGGYGQIAAPRVILDEESEAVGGPTDPWYFPRPEDYRPVLEAAGFTLDDGHVQLRHQRRSFPDVEAMIGMLRSQTYPAYEGGMTPEARATFRHGVEERAPRELLRHDGTYDMDFVRMDVFAQRAS